MPAWREEESNDVAFNSERAFDVYVNQATYSLYVWLGVKFVSLKRVLRDSCVIRVAMECGTSVVEINRYSFPRWPVPSRLDRFVYLARATSGNNSESVNGLTNGSPNRPSSVRIVA